MLVAYAQAVPAGFLQVWVGVLGREAPQTPRFVIDGTSATCIGATSSLAPIRDGRTGPTGRPLNHHGVFRLQVIPGRGRHEVVVQLEGESDRVLLTNSLPASIPSALDGSFNILLSSCYYQPEDESGRLGSTVSQIQLQPHLTVLAGDQIYGDLPIALLPETVEAHARHLGEKYERNWASAQLRTPGLEPVLARAPVVNIPDDHEFWNNYPFKQKQLTGTWTGRGRDAWRDAARALYEDYQLGAPTASQGATRLDVDPLRMLFLDMRCDREDKFGGELMGPNARNALDAWCHDLLADADVGRSAVGVLGSGQALFVDPARDSRKKAVDAEMSNYRQFDSLVDALARLASAGVPVIYMTGDVHWSRITAGIDRVAGADAMLYEVICSPSRLIAVPVLDTVKEAWHAAAGLFGKHEDWPRHGNAQKPPGWFGKNKRFELRPVCDSKGDQVAMISFTRAGTGIDFSVSYYAIHPDKAVARSRTAGPFRLRNSFSGRAI